MPNSSVHSKNPGAGMRSAYSLPHSFLETVAGIESLRRNLDCKQFTLVTNNSHVPELPQRTIRSDNKFGFFFTGQND